MTENETIEILQTEKACVTRAMKNECNRDCYNCDLCKEGKDILTVYDSVINALEERERYRAIGTIEELQELKEKSVVKKPSKTIVGCYKCPCCGATQMDTFFYSGYSYCHNCGQKLDWQ